MACPIRTEPEIGDVCLPQEQTCFGTASQTSPRASRHRQDTGATTKHGGNAKSRSVLVTWPTGGYVQQHPGTAMEMV